MATPKKPIRGILKTSLSFDNPDYQPKEMKWDEMNIIATHHPPDKDYGHMKVDEPPTPYSKYSDPEDDDTDGDQQRRSSVQGDAEYIDPSAIMSRLEDNTGPKVLQPLDSLEESSEEDEEETEEEKALRKTFEQKRKLHYNEFHAVKLAKQLMDEDEGVDEGVDEGIDEETEDLKVHIEQVDSVENETSGVEAVSVSDDK